jgi:hypothetical protein
MTINSTLRKVTPGNPLLGVVFCFLAAACGNESERPETITKLRAIGVEQTPVNAKIGDTVQLTFYLLGKPQTTLTPEVLLDTKSPYSTPVAVTPVDAAPVETSMGSLSLYSYRATMTVAGSPVIAAALTKLGWARLRYQVKFNAAGDDENIVGDTIVYPENSPALTWTAPTIAITKPSATVSSGTVDLEGTIDSAGNETNRVSWFVSSGKVKNRRAKSTVWQEAASGTQTVVMTVRGTKSGAFALKTQTVTLN